MHRNNSYGRIVLFVYHIARKILLPTGIGKFNKIQMAKKIIRDFVSSRVRYRHIFGHKMYLDSKDTLQLSFSGVHERFTTQFVMQEIKKGDVVLDIGANIGYYTLIFAKLVGDNGKVFAFEPEPNNFALLKKNVEINGYHNVVLIEKAVSNKNGKTRLYLAKENLGDHRIYESEVIIGRNSIEIDTVRLDDYFKDYEEKIDFIKMDIQGAEPAAFEGMIRLLEKKHPKLLTEFWPGGLNQFGVQPGEYINLIVRNGFKLYDLNEDKEIVEPIINNNSFLMDRLETNLLCINK